MTEQEQRDLENIRKIRDGGTLKIVTADYVIWRHDYYCKDMARRIIPVRCRDCADWEPPTKDEAADGGTVGHCRNRYGVCEGQQTDATWFCADVERRDGWND